LINGEIDLYLGPVKPNVEGFTDAVLQSAFNPVSIELRSYYFGDKPSITRKEELIGKNLLTIRGYTYGGLVNYVADPANQINNYSVSSFGQALKVLKQGRADYHLDYRKTGEIHLQEHPEPDLKHSTIANVKLYFLVSKSAPDAEGLLARLESAFKRLQAAK
jgi:polar amino acid transport system substrate-binding protein